MCTHVYVRWLAWHGRPRGAGSVGAGDGGGWGEGPQQRRSSDLPRAGRPMGAGSLCARQWGRGAPPLYVILWLASCRLAEGGWERGGRGQEGGAGGGEAPPLLLAWARGRAESVKRGRGGQGTLTAGFAYLHGALHLSLVCNNTLCMR